jgi:hypothetical protein
MLTTYKNLFVLIKRKLFNNKKITITIERDVDDEDHLEVEFITNERKNKS